MNSSAPTARAAAATSSSVASGRPKAMFSRTVPGEEEALLRDDPELAPEALLRHVAQVVAVDRDPAFARVVEAREELGDRRLARRRCGRRARPSSRPGRRGRSRAGSRARRRSRSARRRSGRAPSIMRQAARVRPVEDLRLLVHHVHDLVERGHGREERVVELRELLDGVEEVREVEQEGEERADRDLALEREPAAEPEHGRPWPRPRGSRRTGSRGR